MTMHCDAVVRTADDGIADLRVLMQLYAQNRCVWASCCGPTLLETVFLDAAISRRWRFDASAFVMRAVAPSRRGARSTPTANCCKLTALHDACTRSAAPPQRASTRHFRPMASRSRSKRRLSSTFVFESQTVREPPASRRARTLRRIQATKVVTTSRDGGCRSAFDGAFRCENGAINHKGALTSRDGRSRLRVRCRQ